ncbi:unnamed protein product [Macrosiphum euphorbiae]|uniref:Uncharacterized protein n=1 Tax=Macrosiphum euphorbiae TaxID=13131 RepID=A0AAV0VJB9_9HEMI|nr:unnamed protein product [Macrosiphum euphorbiae]
MELDRSPTSLDMMVAMGNKVEVIHLNKAQDNGYRGVIIQCHIYSWKMSMRKKSSYHGNFVFVFLCMGNIFFTTWSIPSVLTTDRR